MSDHDVPAPDDTRLARYARRLQAIEARVAALPGFARELFRKYRRSVELCGRCGPGGSELRLVEEFLSDLETAFTAQWGHYCSVTRSAGYVTQGSGA